MNENEMSEITLKEAADGLLKYLQPLSEITTIYPNEDEEVLYVHTTNPQNWVDIPGFFPLKTGYPVKMVHVDRHGRVRSVEP